MNSELFSLAKKFIDEVGSDIIESRHFKDFSILYKTTVTDLIKEITTKNKKEPIITDELKILFSEKFKKDTTNKEKTLFYREQCEKILKFLSDGNIKLEFCDIVRKLISEDKASFNRNYYEKWIDWSIRHGEGCYLSTHNSRLSHSSSKGSSIDIRYYSDNIKNKLGYINTDLKYISLDWSYYDNSYSSIAGFYFISDNDGNYLGDAIRRGEDILSGFTTDKTLLSYWNKKLGEYIVNKHKKSFFLNKQIYFPIEDNQYHLLLPLVSSSLAQQLYEEFQQYFNDEQKNARACKKESKYTNTIAISYPNKAVLKVTASNHYNASKLNGMRGGKLSLLNAEPPQWKSSFSNIKTKQNIFDHQLENTIKEEITELKNYLRLLKNKKLSISHPVRNAAIRTKALAVISSFFDYIEMLVMAESQPNWASSSNLPFEQQLLFEPWREDDAVKDIKLNKQWQKELSIDFGRWLNKQLNSGKKNRLNLTPIHEAIWTDWFLYKLKEYSDIKEVSL